MMQLLFLTLYQTETGLTVSIPDHKSNSPSCLPYSSHDVSFENSVLNQLTIAQSLFLSLVFLAWCRYVEEKFCYGDSWELKGKQSRYKWMENKRFLTEFG